MSVIEVVWFSFLVFGGFVFTIHALDKLLACLKEIERKMNK